MPAKKLLTSAPEPKRLSSPPSTPLLTEAKTDWLCVVSFVSACLYIVSMVGMLVFDGLLEVPMTFLVFPFFVLTVVFGILGLLSTKEKGTRGKGWAIVGLAVAGLSVILFVVGIVLLISSPPDLSLTAGFA